MYRILIVDDEKNERDCILYLLQNSDLRLEIREAEDGVAALELLSDWPVHILFTDVQMPRMDGLELIRRALALNPAIKPIIFSGYADFEYAKTAISLGVGNYILKPVVPEEFMNTMTSLIRQLDEEQSMSRQQENQKELLLQYALHQSIFGSFDTPTADPYVLSQLSGFRYMLMFCFKTGFLMEHSPAFFRSIREQLCPDAVSLSASSDQALLLIRTPLEDPAVFCSSLMEYIRQQFHTSCYIAISRLLTQYPSFKEAFAVLEQQMEQRFWAPDIWIYLPDMNPAKEDDVCENDAQLLPLIKNAVAARNGAALSKYLDHLFSVYSLQTNQSQIYVKFLFSNLLTILYQALPESAWASMPPLEAQISSLYLQPDITEIFRMIHGLADQVLASFVPRPEPQRKEVASVLEYIRTHYDQELSVEILASVVFLTPDYLSRLFKKTVGKSISQYVRQFRMEKAREALLQTRNKVIDIGVRCGYPNYSYFCQCFREYYGMSPEKYRQENL